MSDKDKVTKTRKQQISIPYSLNRAVFEHKKTFFQLIENIDNK